jgi:hypothetical protein
MPAIDAYLLASGSVRVRVFPSETYRRSREVATGDDVRDEYVYRIDRVDGPNGTYTLFLQCLDQKPGKAPKYVYTGVLDPRRGTLRLTKRSAFPEHATRVKVARIALPLLFAGKAAELKAMGWNGGVNVLKELAGRW